MALLPVTPLAPAVLLANKAAWAAGGFVVSIPLRSLYRGVIRSAPPSRLAAVAILGSLVTAAVWLTPYVILAGPPAAGTVDPVSAVLRTYLGLAVALGVWSAAYIAAALSRIAGAERLARANAERLAHEARLHALRQPLNPHFLFNTLTSLRTLITENPQRARDAITQLAELLRDSLSDVSDDFIPVSQEMAAVRRYLALELMRFEERLETRVVVDHAVTHLCVPIFSIRSLVENAVKHGRPGSNGRLVLDISIATARGGGVAIRVCNTGQLLRDSPVGTAIGLRNLRERLQRLLPGRHDFVLAQEDGLVTASLTLQSTAGS
jgi:LytS/YehU family sensor histidine kinase